MNLNAFLLGALLASALAARAENSSDTWIEPPAEAPTGDLLQFLDGSQLHGHLASISTNEGVAWRHPDVGALIPFKPSNLAWIRFENPKFVATPAKPTCRFRFKNGDEVFGDLNAITESDLQLQTWFGPALGAPRETVQSVTMLSKGYSILYEGPAGPEGWVQGRIPRGWEYRDGAFVATGAGTLGRDFRLSGSCSVSFDLAWSGHFSLIVALYTSVLDRFDYSSSSYMFYLNPGYITLQRVQGGAGAINLGQAQIQEMTAKSKLHLDIRANKTDSTLGLFVDDHLVQRWKDSAGFVGQGSGIVFFAQLDGPSISISNMKVAQWEGDFGLDMSTNIPTKEDLVYLVNHDKVTGKLEGLRDGTLTITAADAHLKIPLSRVSQICLGTNGIVQGSPDPWELRAHFAGGGAIGFHFDQWKDGLVTGSSRNFGKLELDPKYFRQLQFNLARSSQGLPEQETDDDWEIQ